MPKAAGSNAGFRTSTMSIISETDGNTQFESGSMASTYCALCILKIVGDDLSRVNRPEIAGMVRRTLVERTGAYRSHVDGLEQDMRFVYCASAISEIIDDWSGVDAEAVLRYICSV
jgi:geranylgeranyl transferase type-1 subunit beta